MDLSFNILVLEILGKVCVPELVKSPVLNFGSLFAGYHTGDNTNVFPAPVRQTKSWLGDKVSGFVLNQVKDHSVFIWVFVWSWEMFNIVHARI